MLNTKKLLTKTLDSLSSILNLLYESSWEQTGTQNVVNYKKKNGIVFVSCYISGKFTINTNYQIIATLPSGYIPSITIYSDAGINNSSGGVAYVNTSGEVGIKTYSGTSTYAWFQFSYPADPA